MCRGSRGQKQSIPSIEGCLGATPLLEKAENESTRNGVGGNQGGHSVACHTDEYPGAWFVNPYIDGNAFLLHCPKDKIRTTMAVAATIEKRGP
ncbi:MAG TPA: hypothetical protein VNE63_20650 [Candidatus Acidoferrales bacterium]|nr:hypothetical protein [Candidatus Acidoferrales bacterium]